MSASATHGLSFNATRLESEHNRSCRKVLSKVERVERFRTWLAVRFDCEASAATAFGVAPRTVRNWQNGDTAPRYADGIQAMLIDPDAIPFLTGKRDVL